MLSIVKLSWVDFEEIIKKRLGDDLEFQTNGHFGYRGQSDAEWHLETTLERYIKSKVKVERYFDLINRIQSKIVTFTDWKWDDLPNSRDFINTLTNNPYNLNDSTFIYMTYLRHFGFPSPLLDWSYSPFVAAYFAFRDASSTAKSVAIYEFFASRLMRNSAVSDERAQIFPIIASPQKNKRHEFQQSFYTICLREINNDIYYESHEDQRMIVEDDTEYITKYVLPASERIRALHCLESYNINAYSLFGTEESLLETLFLQTYKSTKMTGKQYGMSDDDLWS